jgi:hypothetical protein
MLKPNQVAHRAIRKLVPNADCTIGETYESIGWSNESREKPTKAEFNTAMTSVTAEYDALAWKRSREAEYPSVADLVVALYDTDDKSAVEAKRAAVKLKYPKPE